MSNGPTVRRRPAASPVPETTSGDLTVPTTEEELGRLTDAMNTGYARAEAALRRFSCAGAVEIESGEPGHHWLAFRKQGSAWKLLHVINEAVAGPWDAPFREVSATPIASAPRWFRVAAAMRLSDLVTSVSNAAREETARVRGAVAALDKVLDDLGAPDVDDSDDSEIPF